MTQLDLPFFEAEITTLSQRAGSVIFALTVLHTLFVKQLSQAALRFPKKSLKARLLTHLGEVEVAFGFWAIIFLVILSVLDGFTTTFSYLRSRVFDEPLFVFVILIVCSTTPMLHLAERWIWRLARTLPLKPSLALYVTIMILGPLLGSFITEPAAMTVTALILLKYFFKKTESLEFKVQTFGLLLMNISIGGALSNYAAPPVLMVARVWNWTPYFMFANFGWKSVLACSLSTTAIAWWNRKEIASIPLKTKLSKSEESNHTPLWIQVSHLVFLAGCVLGAHNIQALFFLFVSFLIFIRVTHTHQKRLRVKEAFLIALFLAGLVILGGVQSWWIEPLIHRLSEFPLYLGAIVLTAFTDNALLTYLGSTVEGLSASSQYALVAGAIVGGGLTLIANAPNPLGYSLLKDSFGKDGISGVQLFRAALFPTLIAGLCFWLL